MPFENFAEGLLPREKIFFINDTLKSTSME
jgi:hypothetical protein